MGRFLALLLLLPMLAGCTTPSEQVSECPHGDLALCDLEAHYAQHDCVKNDVTPRVYAPDSPSPGAQPSPWVQGDWWEYTLAVNGEDHGKTRLIYYDDQDIVNGQAQHYMVGAPSFDEALQHALYSNNPVLGRIHRTLYSPHESGVHADMFHFPLCEGSTWESKFFGRNFVFAASQSTVDIGPQTDANGFLIIGRAADGSSISLTYSPRAKWFGELHLSRNDGFTVDMEMTARGHAAMGEAYFLRGQKDEVFDLAVQPAVTDVEREPGKEGPYDLLGFHMELEPTSERVEVHLVDPSGQSVACVGHGAGPLGPTSCPGELTQAVPWVEGTWQVRVDAPFVGDVDVAGEVRLVSIYDRSGTV